MLKDIIKQIILTFQSDNIRASYPRELKFKIIEGKVLTLIGMRRTGKSTILQQIVTKLINDGVSRENIVFINFVDERLARMKSEELAVVPDAYYEQYPEKRKNEKVYFFFDEIQNIEGWEMFVERVLRTENSQIFLSGSSAKLLSKEIASAMRGRSLSYEVFPFSFTELLTARGIDYHRLTTINQSLIVKTFDEYLQYGGFPEVINQDPATHRQILQEYYRTVLFRDIIERHNTSSPQLVSEIMSLVTRQSAGMFTINKIMRRLQSMGFKLQKSDVSDVLDWMNDAYMFFPITIGSESVAKRNTNPKKGYLVDNGIATALQLGLVESKGLLLENLVFMALRRRYSEIHYYKTSSGYEIDFIYIDEGKPRIIQVAASLHDEDTKAREIRALWQGMDDLGIKTGLLLTLNDSAEFTQDDKMIQVMPVWQYLISKEAVLQ